MTSKVLFLLIITIKIYLQKLYLAPTVCFLKFPAEADFWDLFFLTGAIV